MNTDKGRLLYRVYDLDSFKKGLTRHLSNIPGLVQTLFKEQRVDVSIYFVSGPGAAFGDVNRKR